ncbi:MAG TPA: hypothetical protein VHS80_00205 [Chthoniobacterales bacterium]|nr:hypothetical protein [Chthoniobacterales bacterium]
MVKNLFARFKPLVHLVVRLFGTRVHDVETGADLGKYLFISWRGRIVVIGLGNAHSQAFQPIFLPQARASYASQVLGFKQHSPPDFPNIRSTAAPTSSHNNPSATET